MLLSYAKLSKDVLVLIGLPGELFMNMLQALVLPLLVSSLISGLSQLDFRSSRKLGIRAILYYLLTTIMATVVGISLVTLIHPGNPDIKASSKTAAESAQNITTKDALLDLI
ncbi:hypothetical protein COOONC_08093, partial [Cooperia oncophora]